MSAQTPTDKQIKSVLKYDTSQPYFGQFKFSDLYQAQSSLRKADYYDACAKMRDARVYVGKIDGDVICGALWHLMGYNPGRFTANPFVFGGQNNIFKFVTTEITWAMDATTAGIIGQLRDKLRDYLYVNAAPNGQWRDAIRTDSDGYVYTILKDGRTGPMYKILCTLRDAVQLITRQNCADFELKRGPYRAGIIQSVKSRHPHLFPVENPVSQSETAPSAAYNLPEFATDEDKIDARIEQLQITLDNRDYVSEELYEQARSEMMILTDVVNSNHQK